MLFVYIGHIYTESVQTLVRTSLIWLPCLLICVTSLLKSVHKLIILDGENIIYLRGKTKLLIKINDIASCEIFEPPRSNPQVIIKKKGGGKIRFALIFERKHELSEILKSYNP